jgi:hypothetical protein
MAAAAGMRKPTPFDDWYEGCECPICKSGYCKSYKNGHTCHIYYTAMNPSVYERSKHIHFHEYQVADIAHVLKVFKYWKIRNPATKINDEVYAIVMRVALNTMPADHEYSKTDKEESLEVLNKLYPLTPKTDAMMLAFTHDWNRKL